MREAYLTLSGSGDSELVEKKSRFIGAARYADSEKSAERIINEIRAARKDASHNVFAYIIGAGGGIGAPKKRMSDDGEPQGTAGVPVLEVLEKSGIRDAAVVVTRYFGGTLLGAAGLIRAYGKAASLAVAAAGVEERLPAKLISVLVEYPFLGIVRNEIETRGLLINEIIYGADAELRATVPREQVNALFARLTDLTSGALLTDTISDTYISKKR